MVPRCVLAPHGSAPGQWTVRVIRARSRRRPRCPLRRLDDAGARVAACLDGQNAAFDVIVERHRRSVYQVCYRFVGNHEDASDLSQETFVQAWRGLRGFKGQAQLSTWLYRIAVNMCLNRVQREGAPNGNDRGRWLRGHDRPKIPAPASSAASAPRPCGGRSRSCPNKQRATLILRAYQELSHREIADILGSSVGAVKANFFHALANLKKILGSEP